MSETTLDRFGKLIIESLRDHAVLYYDDLASGHKKAPNESLQSELQSFDERQQDIIRRCVILAIDAGIHRFLFRVYELAKFEKSIRISIDGEDVSTLSDGLEGELFGKNGWFAKYSKYDSEW